MASSLDSLVNPPVNCEALETSSEALEEDSLFDMLNEYVMAHLFTFLPVDDIKNCRLVSKVWNQATLKAIPKIAHVLRVPTDGKDELTELINLISSSPQFPWTNFEVNVYGVEEYGSKNLLAKLFGLVAPFATGIWIDYLEKRLFTEVFTYPTLKHLRLDYGLLDAENIDTDFGLSIVENAPNLVMLDLRGLQITDHALDLLGSSNGRKITRLEMRSLVEDQHLVRFSELGLQLNHLSIHFRSTKAQAEDDESIGPESIKAVLEGQSAHLKELELSDRDEDPRTMRECCGFLFVDVEFPRMDQLTELKISAFNADYQNICFSTYFPSLRKLEFGELDTLLSGESEVFYLFLKSDMAPVETLEELKFNNDDLYTIEDCQLIVDAAKQFPNLRKLQIPNKKALLDCVGLSMANVKELWLLFSHAEDLTTNLTGLSKEACEMIAKLPESQQKSWEEKWEPPLCFRKIAKLGLVAEKVGQYGSGIRYAVQLTEIGCRFGLLKMEQLKSLELIGEISDNLLTQLRNNGKFRVEVRNDHY